LGSSAARNSVSPLRVSSVGSHPMPEDRPVHKLVCQLHGIHWHEVWDLFRSAFDAWVDDKAPRLGAALAFYTALSLAPLLVVVLAIAGLFYGQKAVEGQLVWQMQDMVGVEG